jgi:hypothetical protein
MEWMKQRGFEKELETEVVTVREDAQGGEAYTKKTNKQTNKQCMCRCKKTKIICNHLI